MDPSAAAAEPGWPLRNLLALMAARFGVRRVRVLCWKDDIGESTQRRSVIGDVALPEDAAEGERLTGAHGMSLDTTRRRVADLSTGSAPLATQPGLPDVPLAVGWERNSSGKLAPKLADLGPLMDPRRLADQAVDLNLKLMRWRIMPEINLERVQQTKCLLLGAGTLGCYVARTLLVRYSPVLPIHTETDTRAVGLGCAAHHTRRLLARLLFEPGTTAALRL